MRVILTIENGPGVGERAVFSRKGRFVIGRGDDAGFVLPDPGAFLSRHHAAVELDPPVCRLLDLTSRNGTYRNGERLTGPAPLEDGDRIRVGETGIRVNIDHAEAEAGAAPVCHCHQCRAEVANSDADGRAAELSGVARYFCGACAGKMQRLDGVHAGPYRLLRLVGSGSLGRVYLAWHEQTGRTAALKLLTEGAEQSEKAVKLFQREMAVLRDLHHPGIVRLFDQGLEDGRHYFASEYLEGGDVGELVGSRSGPLRVDEARHLILQVLEGLQYAHSRDYIHRDIKPANLLLSGQTVKIADFGLAKNFITAGASGMTRRGEASGSLLFMAPEQIANYRFAKPPADVYSTGITLYYLLTGKFPFDFPSPLDRLLGRALRRPVKSEVQIVLKDEPIPVLEQAPHIPAKLAAVVDRSIRKSEADRTPSAVEMKRALEEAL